jgi:hypothetical protein
MQSQQQVVLAYDAFVGNKSNKDYIIKCVSVINVCENSAQQFDFAPPFDWNLLKEESKQQNYYLARNVHGLSWYAGDIPHSKLTCVLKEKTDCAGQLYAKGEEACKFLRTLLGRVVLNIETDVMTHLPAEQLSSLQESNKKITLRCAGDHSGLDPIVAASLLRNPACCFTRALRTAEFLKAYNTNKQHALFKMQTERHQYYTNYYNMQHDENTGQVVSVKKI